MSAARLVAQLSAGVLSIGLAFAAQAAPPPGASSCSGCHARAAIDTAVPSVHGRAKEEIVAAMIGFRSGKLPATVMDRIAKGFSEEEIGAIAEWLSQQR